MKRGAKINKSTPSGWTPLDCALLNGRLNAVAMLLSGQYGAAFGGVFGLNGSPNLEGHSFVYNPCLLPICFNKDDSSYVDVSVDHSLGDLVCVHNHLFCIGWKFIFVCPADLVQPPLICFSSYPLYHRR